MKCPECGKMDLRVVDSRPRPADETIWRRRECRKCGVRWNTWELSYEDMEALYIALRKNLTGK